MLHKSYNSNALGKAAQRGRLRRGWTLIELLVAISVVGLVAAVALPAVQQARESARATQCQNNLRQLALGMQSHESQYQRFPSNGWGYRWVGDPDRGTDERQPGGWIYSILDFVEQGPLRARGAGLSDTEKSAAVAAMITTPVPLLKCPTRPCDQLGPANPAVALFNGLLGPNVARTDYAVNEGDVVSDTREGPLSLEQGDSGDYPWIDRTLATGICFQRSRIRPQDVRDGLSNTYLLGEKFVSSAHYDDGGDLGYDQSLYNGVDLDVNRWTIAPPVQDVEFASMEMSRRFGSAHSGGCFMAMCDGSVRRVSYLIDVFVHQRSGDRLDGITQP